MSISHTHNFFFFSKTNFIQFSIYVTSLGANSEKLYYSDYAQDQEPRGQLSLLLSFLFPSPSLLQSRYVYLVKCKWLLPWAWFHRIFSNIFRREILQERKLYLFRRKTISKIKKRAILLQWLELR